MIVQLLKIDFNHTVREIQNNQLVYYKITAKNREVDFRLIAQSFYSISWTWNNNLSLKINLGYEDFLQSKYR